MCGAWFFGGVGGGEQSWSLCSVGFVVCVGMWRGDGFVVLVVLVWLVEGVMRLERFRICVWSSCARCCFGFASAANIIFLVAFTLLKTRQIRSRNRARERSRGRSLTSFHFICFLTTWIMVDNSSKCIFVLISMLGRVKNI